MTNETQQPFTPDQPRDPRDEELVGKVLGSKERADMKELTGDQPQATKTQDPSTNLKLSAKELAEEERILQETTPESMRKKFIEWAEDIGKNEEWVDKVFSFELDGKVKVDDILLTHIGISEIPPIFRHLNTIGLYLFSNQITRIGNIPTTVKDLDLQNNQITTVENIPNSVTSLTLKDNQITEIKDIPDECIDVILDNNPINSLDSLVGKTIVFLSIKNTNIKSIPQGIDVTQIEVDPSQTELIADARAKGYDIHIAQPKKPKPKTSV